MKRFLAIISVNYYTLLFAGYLQKFADKSLTTIEYVKQNS